jgi:hypothetical protein
LVLQTAPKKYRNKKAWEQCAPATTKPDNQYSKTENNSKQNKKVAASPLDATQILNLFYFSGRP